MRLKKYIINEAQEQKADGLSKAKLKTLIYKSTKKITTGLYNDNYWKGPQMIWNVFDGLDLDWYITKAEYKNNRDDAKMGINMPTSKVWNFEFKWVNDKGKVLKGGGYLTAAGAGSMDQPLDKYDLVLIIY